MDNSAWKRIQKLRQSYLDAKGFLPDYWQDDELLLAYDETLAERIRWKWRAVIDVLPLEIKAFPKTVVDWGCGTGGASREMLRQHPEHFEKAILLDRSSRAVSFAARKVKAEHPKIKVETKAPLEGETYILVISHVLSELPEEELSKLMPLVQRATLLLWVEAGRPQESRRLSGIRSLLSSSHRFLAPCPHQETCGMLKEGQEENWCHFKAPVPKEVHHSAFWRECAKQLGVDLRSLPVSYLFAARKDSLEESPSAEELRVLAGSRQYKGYTRFNACGVSGIIQADYMKRHSKKIYEALAEPGLDLKYETSELILKDNDDASL